MITDYIRSKQTVTYAEARKISNTGLVEMTGVAKNKSWNLGIEQVSEGKDEFYVVAWRTSDSSMEPSDIYENIGAWWPGRY